MHTSCHCHDLLQLSTDGDRRVWLASSRDHFNVVKFSLPERVGKREGRREGGGREGGGTDGGKEGRRERGRGGGEEKEGRRRIKPHPLPSKHLPPHL
jgi:hypothetical protein